MSAAPVSSHRFESLFGADDSRVLSLHFHDGDISHLRCFCIVDPSIYGDPDRWSAIIVEPVSGRHPDFKRRFAAGKGLDFVESDVTSVADILTGDVLFSKSGAA